MRPVLQPGNISFLYMTLFLRINCIIMLLLPATLFGQGAVADEDFGLAKSLKKKFKDDAYAAVKMQHQFTFDRGKDDNKQAIVTAEENGSVEFIGIKDFAVFQYYEYHNRFMKLKSFQRFDKYQTRYGLTGRAGYDRSVTDDNIFFDDSRVQFYSFRFMEKGRMAKVNWNREYMDGKYLTRMFFHEYFPVAEKVIEFKVPQWLDVEIREMNFEGYNISKTTSTEGKNTVYRFTAKDLPGLKTEARDLGIAYSHPHVIIQVKSFENGTEKKNVFQNTQDLYNWYRYLYKMSVNEPAQLKDVVTRVTTGKGSDEEKIKAIYYWVQDNIRYIAYEEGYSGYVPATAQEVYNVKYGDCKGMANLLTEMLRLGGFDAHFTWIGTRHIPYDHSIPAMCVDNHAISTLYLKGKEYFLDATEKYVPLGENAYRIQGKSALIEKGESFDEKKVPMTTGADHKIKTQATLSLNGELLKGRVKITMTGNERTDFHQVYQELALTAREDYLKNILELGNDNLNGSNITTSNLNNRELPVVVEGDIDLSNTINQIGDDRYVAIDFFPKNLTAFTPDAKRSRGYDFESVFTYEDEIELVLPANRKCIDLPEPLKLDNPDYTFSGVYETKGNKLLLKKVLSIKNSVIPFQQMEAWKQFLVQIRDFNRNMITIVKGDSPATPASKPTKPVKPVKPAGRN
jgi:transglutaminase-like putative cysteine protease